MTGFRSGESGGLMERAKRAGRAMGKRRDRPSHEGTPSSSLQPQAPPVGPVRPVSKPVDLNAYRRDRRRRRKWRMPRAIPA